MINYYDEGSDGRENAKKATIPTGSVIEKLDEYLAADDYAAAERHLTFWLGEAEEAGDLRGKLTVLNEQIALYRKAERGVESLTAAETALRTVERLGLSGSVTEGTTLVNAATAYRAFGQAEKAKELYEKARAIYEGTLSESDRRLGGLYNNEASTLASLGEYEKAKELYARALSVMEKNEGSEAERAVTYCNLADLYAEEQGLEDGEPSIREALHNAETLLDCEAIPRNGYYASVCEKCAPTFGYYGYFLQERELMRRAAQIREKR